MRMAADNGLTRLVGRMLARARCKNRHLWPERRPAWSAIAPDEAAWAVALYGAPAFWASHPEVADRAALPAAKPHTCFGRATGRSSSGTVRAEVTDRMLIAGEQHLRRTLDR
jgi:hypothetical protein